MPEVLNARSLPLAVNVCEQVLREVEQQSAWSMAHVVMNPFAASLVHRHEKMVEVYIITRGFGELLIGDELHEVTAGSVYEIPAGVPHMLKNRSSSHLEHLVLALPPFDPADVELLPSEYDVKAKKQLALPDEIECFDGAKILPYAFPHLDLSVAFGRSINDPSRNKDPHYHNKTTEFVFVVEGQGFFQLNDTSHEVRSGDWIRIDPTVEHKLINQSFEDLVVLCICCAPSFDMSDVLFKNGSVLGAVS
ncbi:MAG: cupin domain-containing protein [Cyanobacteria bacterium]|nr:cupin domain-containing protein [Cyanobacteriota bacterium]